MILGSFSGGTRVIGFLLGVFLGYLRSYFFGSLYVLRIGDEEGGREIEFFSFFGVLVFLRFDRIGGLGIGIWRFLLFRLVGDVLGVF